MTNISIEMTLDDALELSLILMAERIRLDKGDNQPVPQPRWGANVRISQAVQRALEEQQ